MAWSDKATNEADKFIHGTTPKGQRHGLSRLTDEIVIEARRRASCGERVDLIAADMGLPYRRLLDAVAGRRWGHLPGVPRLVKGAQRRQMAMGIHFPSLNVPAADNVVPMKRKAE